jgi:cytochrome c
VSLLRFPELSEVTIGADRDPWTVTRAGCRFPADQIGRAGETAGRDSAPATRFIRVLAILAFIAALSPATRAAEPPAATAFTVLVFSRTTGFRHDSIPDGIAAIETLGVEHGFSVVATEDGRSFTDATLSRFKAVVFLSTTGDVLDHDQKAAFERYIRAGGGFVGHPLCE